MPQPPQWSSVPFMAHESHAKETLFMISEPGFSSMAVVQPGISVTCFHCQASAESCLVDAGTARHCLAAQGWFRSPAKTNNWS